MRTAKYSPIVNVMVNAVHKAARSLARDFGEVEQLQVSRKGPGQFVSAADVRAEKIIYEELLKARPDFGFLMEEQGKIAPKNGEKSIFIIDPLNGTTNFLHGIPHWAISIALEENGTVIAGVIYDPVKDELFYAEKGKGAFINNRRLRVSGRNNLQDAVISISTPAFGCDEDEYLGSMSKLGSIIRSVAATRKFGADCLDLVYVAAGRSDGFWETNLNPCNVAAATIIIRESGGFVTDITGGKDYIYGGSIVAANPNLHKDLLGLVSKRIEKIPA